MDTQPSTVMVDIEKQWCSVPRVSDNVQFLVHSVHQGNICDANGVHDN